MDTNFPATKMVFWPGQTVAACDEHAAELRNLANVMGFEVSITDILHPEIAEMECVNCINQQRVRK